MAKCVFWIGVSDKNLHPLWNEEIEEKFFTFFWVEIYQKKRRVSAKDLAKQTYKMVLCDEMLFIIVKNICLEIFQVMSR